MNGVIASLRPRFAAGLAFCLCLGLAAAALFIAFTASSSTAKAAPGDSAQHLGVATCAGSTCHGRQEGDGKVVRQDEITRQEESSAGGAHSRSLRLITGARGQAIAARLGIGDPANAQMCLGCHVDNAANRGPRFQKGDAIGCEACHGGAQN